MMRPEMVLEMSVSFIHLTGMIAREDFTESCRRKSYRSSLIIIIIIINTKQEGQNLLID
jgi:hypothetical protein